MINILKSEFYKLKHTWIPWAHFILPVLYSLLFYEAATNIGLKNFLVGISYRIILYF